MKNKFILFLVFSIILTFITSCDYILKPRTDKRDNAEQEALSNMVIDATKDKYGCVTSAGYRWSFTKNKCIRVFDEGLRMVPANERNEDIEDDTDQALLNAYLVIDSIENKAEVFIAADTISTIVLDADGSNLYKNSDWKLSTEKQFKLEYKGNLKFVSPIASEKTNINSDVEQ